MDKLVVLDGISGVPLGQELCEAFSTLGITVSYADLRKFEPLMLYGVKSAFLKALNKREHADGFYHLPRLNEVNFEAYIKQESPSVILVIGFVYKYLSPAFLQRIKREYNIRLYLYDTDSCNLYSKRREFIFYIENELPIYDEIFSFSKVTTKFFKETRKLNASFLPFGANDIQQQQKELPSNDVLFVGSCDLRRIFLLEQVHDSVRIYGDRWQRNYTLISEALKSKITDKSVWGSDLYQLLASSKIVLNITRSDFFGAGTGVNLRIFEALAAGCFLLTDYCEEIEELFVIGEEIEVFRSGKELVEKVNFYLANPDLRQKIAQCGHERFLKKHMWSARAEEFRKRMVI